MTGGILVAGTPRFPFFSVQIASTSARDNTLAVIDFKFTKDEGAVRHQAINPGHPTPADPCTLFTS